MNTVSLIGRLTADPDIRAGEKHECASFRLAVPRRSCDKDAADFIDIVTFDTPAATCGEYLTKGRQVAVVGRLRLNEWTTPDGERHSKIQVVADDVAFLDKPKNGKAETAEEAPEIPDRPAVGSYRRRKAARPAPEGAATLAPGWPPPVREER